MSGTRYTREALAEAAEKCSDIDEVIAHLGVRPYHQLRRHLLRRLAHFGIDVSHFPVARRSRHRDEPPPADELRRAVAESTSIAGALRRLGRPDNTSSRTAFRRWTSQAGVDTSHFLGQAHQRGRRSTTSVRRPEEILVKHNGERRTRTALLRRALCETGVPDRCAECGTGPTWYERPMTLEVDHVNGDWSDDRPGNLRLLCPNCHAVTATWCRGGRKGRGHAAGG
ncbi:hypothetical protein GCM10023079_10700 [Streptomyces chitinivorans]|nr:HNH endonuclease signature motif containing protein [Streptomyces chitinivorans]MDH2409440.1 HNH endonuclease signature motif containing protein [Streptomyces chitinivorans]